MHTSRGRTVYPVCRAIPTHAPRQLANSLLADCIAPQTLAIFRMYFRSVGDNPRMSERPFLRSTIYGQACMLMTAPVIAASIGSSPGLASAQAIGWPRTFQSVHPRNLGGRTKLSNASVEGATHRC